jgi:hypothetical protein
MANFTTIQNVVYWDLNCSSFMIRKNIDIIFSQKKITKFIDLMQIVKEFRVANKTVLLQIWVGSGESWCRNAY